jgi:GPH family glycoside/pentoside/hexuronide:cation symporter
VPSENPPRHYHTSPGDRVPLIGKLGYASGGIAVNLMANAVGSLVAMVLNIALGMNPALVGLLVAAPRFFDAIADPLLGAISDNFRSRWGRRKPFMLVGGIGAGILFAALWWMSPKWGEMTLFWYFLALSLVYYLFTSLFSIPWGALGLSITADYHERTRVMAWNSFLCALTGIGLSWFYAMTQMDAFPDTLTGARFVTAGVGFVMIVFAVGSVIFCPDKHRSGDRAETAEPVLSQIKEVFSNRPFLLVGSTVFLMCLGIFSVSSISPYIAIYYIYGGSEKAASVLLGWGGTVWQISSLLLVGAVSAAAVRYGKRHTLAVALLCGLLGNLLKWPCTSPQYPWLSLFPSVFVAFGFCALWTLTASMLADVSDYHELQTGRRSEGSLNAIYAWMMKLGVTAAFAVSGVLLGMTGFDAALGGAQSERTIFLMRLIDTGLPSLAMLGAFILTIFYPISEKRSYEIRAELERRRGRLGGD